MITIDCNHDGDHAHNNHYHHDHHDHRHDNVSFYQEEPVGHHPPPHFLQPNPIDKLYLMQVLDDDDDDDDGGGE